MCDFVSQSSGFQSGWKKLAAKPREHRYSDTEKTDLADIVINLAADHYSCESITVLTSAITQLHVYVITDDKKKTI